ncbi:hypothetical protein DPMN_192348 [Dreissena polymorpha]|uniref:Uncharacterized protein n=1 Tax=Dreissena polymorpha TaxID=45954 RepID=A0A9D4BFJ0_DREPO|nr:hypothetical protein DPMN_192348 [Dreissena polymorpha]
MSEEPSSLHICVRSSARGGDRARDTGFRYQARDTGFRYRARHPGVRYRARDTGFRYRV